MDNCTQGYAGDGCIGTAVHTHSSTLPVTGLTDPGFWVALTVLLLLVGLILRMRSV